jgi:penicillin-binding protein 2
VSAIRPEHETEESQEIPLVLREDPKFAAGKIAFLQYVTIFIFAFLLFGFWQLQVQYSDVFAEAAEKNHVKSVPVLAPRGKILDRDGRVIVDNHFTYRVLLSRETLKPEHIKPVSEGLNLEYDELLSKLSRYDRTRPKYEPIIIKDEITPEELAFVESHRNPEEFPEMELIHAQQRLYPRDGIAAHVIGYVSEISETELNSAEFARYKPGDIVGQAGIERQYNDLLMGQDGERQVMVDNRGRVLQQLGLKEAVPGKNLQLTIDLDLQVVAELALDGRRCAVIALDPRNGEVLAMVSRPSFDPNKFTGRISSKDWKEIVLNPEKPLLNRAIQGQLAPGSTFKPIMAMAGLDNEVIDDDFSIHCAGGAFYYGRPFKCHQKGGHGNVKLRRAISHSCDVFFYAVGNRLGIDRIAEYGSMAGFGRKTGIDLPHEEEGVMPSTKWKLRHSRTRWYAGETISVSIGQGALTVTPLQLASAVGGMAMGGVWQRPHVVKAQEPEVLRRANWNIDNILKVVDGMLAVVNEGTGARSRLPGIEFCGKTGTAQLASNDFVKGSEAGKNLKDTAWFVGFAPRDPEIVVVALFEAGEHGDRAGPIVRDVIKAYFDKKSRITPKSPMLAAAPLLAPPTLPAGRN